MERREAGSLSHAIRRVVAAGAVLSAVVPGAAVAHEVEPTPEERRAVASLAESLRSRAGETSDEAVLRVLRGDSATLAKLSVHSLEHLNDEGLQPISDDAIRSRLKHAVRAHAVRRRHQGILGEDLECAMNLTSDRARDWPRAVVALARMEPGRDLVRVANDMLMDARPEIRYGAGVLAKIHAVFLGSSEATDAIAVSLLTDIDPDVAKFFAGFALDMRSTRALDCMISRLGDRRPGSGRNTCMYFGDIREVRSCFSNVLRCARASGGTPDAVPEDATDTAIADHRKWWESWDGRWPLAPVHVGLGSGDAGPEVDAAVVAALGEAIMLSGRSGRRKWRIVFEECAWEFAASGQPRVTTALSVRESARGSESESAFRIKGAHLAETTRLGADDTVYELTVVPTRREREVRVRLRIW